MSNLLTAESSCDDQPNANNDVIIDINSEVDGYGTSVDGSIRDLLSGHRSLTSLRSASSNQKFKLTRLPSQQIITRQNSDRSNDTKVLQLLEMGFELTMAEIAIERLGKNQPIEQAIQSLLEPTDDLQEIFNQITEQQARQEQYQLRLTKQKCDECVKEPEVELASFSPDIPEDSQTCLICMEKIVKKNFCEPPCGHGTCTNCLFSHFQTRINDGDVILRCIGFDESEGSKMCDRDIEEKEVIQILMLFSSSEFNNEGSILIDKFKKFRKNRKLALNGNIRWCVKPGCETAMEGNDAHPKLKCPACSTLTCSLCRSAFHFGKECNTVMDSEFKKWASSAGLTRVQKCPYCCCTVEKNGGCNHLVCLQCRYEFCWLCRRKYTKDHFSSRSKTPCSDLSFGEKVSQKIIKENEENALKDVRFAKEELRILQDAERHYGRCLSLQPFCTRFISWYHHNIVPFVVPLLIIFSILVLNFLVRDNGPMKWAETIPYILVVLIIYAGFSCICCSRFARWRVNPFHTANGALPELVREIPDEPFYCKHCVWLTIFSFLIFSILFILRLTDTMNFKHSYTILLLPLMIPLAVGVCVSVGDAISYCEDSGASLFFGGVFTIVLVFIILVDIKLEGISIQMSFVFIPVILIILFSSIAYAFIFEDVCEHILLFLLGCFIIFCGIAFVVLYLIFKDSQTGGGLNYWTAFIPFFTLEFICCSG